MLLASYSNLGKGSIISRTLLYSQFNESLLKSMEHLWQSCHWYVHLEFFHVYICARLVCKYCLSILVHSMQRRSTLHVHVLQVKTRKFSHELIPSTYRTSAAVGETAGMTKPAFLCGLVKENWCWLAKLTAAQKKQGIRLRVASIDWQSRIVICPVFALLGQYGHLVLPLLGTRKCMEWKQHDFWNFSGSHGRLLSVWLCLIECAWRSIKTIFILPRKSTPFLKCRRLQLFHKLITQMYFHHWQRQMRKARTSWHTCKAWPRKFQDSNTYSLTLQQHYSRWYKCPGRMQSCSCDNRKVLAPGSRLRSKDCCKPYQLERERERDWEEHKQTEQQAVGSMAYK